MQISWIYVCPTDLKEEPDDALHHDHNDDVIA